ncbi:hypothetical protein [Photobacterium leiognathi]|uniref:hypothetical protein n=1 Tax=Photobacterium leiognathi TaxID=553611 RepID=UPI0027394487|nr:hypothetical protein [Photobacterium leiognathi]
MNKKQINILSWAISIISCLFLFVIFFLSMITFHKEAIIESEIELQKNKFEKILLIEKSLKKKFNSLTIPTQEQQKEIDKLLTCRCNISSVSVIYNNQYVYSTLSLYSNTGPADFKKGFSLKVKNTLTDRPVIRYSFHVNETTVLKFYLKPFEFSYIKKLGSPKINLF